MKRLITVTVTTLVGGLTVALSMGLGEVSAAVAGHRWS